MLEVSRVLSIADVQVWSSDCALSPGLEHICDCWSVNLVFGRERAIDHVSLDNIIQLGSFVGSCAMLVLLDSCNLKMKGRYLHQHQRRVAHELQRSQQRNSLPR
jgi:hypothetical protein